MGMNRIPICDVIQARTKWLPTEKGARGLTGAKPAIELSNNVESGRCRVELQLRACRNAATRSTPLGTGIVLQQGIRAGAGAEPNSTHSILYVPKWQPYLRSRGECNDGRYGCQSLLSSQ